MKENRESILREKVLSCKKGDTPHFSYKEWESKPLFKVIKKIYMELGGTLEEFPYGYRNFDIIYDGVYIELDEEQHFNRYRELTLHSEVYNNSKIMNIEKYKTFCKTYELICIKKKSSVGFWSKESSDHQFGISSKERDFSGNGSSRWKQRAFYDFLKDAYSISEELPLIRISVWDVVEIDNEVFTINNILLKNDEEKYPAIKELIITKIKKMKSSI